jgi:hypothetical protein
VSHRSRLFFLIGCWAALATSVIHLIGSMAGGPVPTNETERTFFHLLETYKFPLPGTARTFGELNAGLGLSFSLLLALVGASGLAVVRRSSTDPLLLPALARMHAAAFIALVVISLTHWFIIPTLCIGVTVVAFVIAALPGGSPVSSSGGPQ